MNVRSSMPCTRCPLAWDLCLDREYSERAARGDVTEACPSARAMRRLIDMFWAKHPNHGTETRSELMRRAAGGPKC